MSEKVGSGAIALLLVMSVLAPFAVGTASADTYTKTVDSSRAVVIETSGTDEAQIEIKGTYTEDGTEYTHFLRRVTVTSDKKHYLVDLKAYDSYDVTVQTSSGTTTVDIYGDDYAGGGAGYNSIGHTGGDTDLNCGLGAQTGALLGTYFTDCNPVPEQSINTTELNGNETELDIYQNAQTDLQATENLHQTYDNYLEDTRNTALLIAKNEYIRKLNNGSTESVARSAAKSAAADYYATKQLQLINSYNRSISNYQYQINKAESEAGISQTSPGQNFFGDDHTDSFVTHDGTDRAPTYNIYVTVEGFTTYSGSLVNGSSFTMETFQVGVRDEGTKRSGGPHAFNWQRDRSSSFDGQTATPPNDDQYYIGHNADYFLSSLYVEAPNSNYEDVESIHLVDYKKRWDKIESQQDSVNSEIDTFVNNTYDEYQSGEISNEDLIDPYVAAREYGPDPANFSAWATTSLTLLGTNSPDALENTGNFSVTDQTDNTTYNGILLSDENPSGGAFEAGGSYNATQLNGTQYVVTDEQVHELTGGFTVDEIKTKDGETVDKADYREINYGTTNTSGYQQVLDEIAATQADIDALQLAATAGGGGTSGTGPPDFVANLLKSVGAPVNPVTRGAAVVGGGTGILAVVGRVIAG